MGEKKNVKDQDGKAGPVLEELRIPTQVKLAGLWATVMFMYIYVDIIGFFKPGMIADILVGKAWVFDIDQTWLLLSLMLMTVPGLMVCLSLALPAKSEPVYEHRSGCIPHLSRVRDSPWERSMPITYSVPSWKPSFSRHDRMDRMEVAQGPKEQCGRELI